MLVVVAVLVLGMKEVGLEFKDAVEVETADVEDAVHSHHGVAAASRCVRGH